MRLAIIPILVVAALCSPTSALPVVSDDALVERDVATAASLQRRFFNCRRGGCGWAAATMGVGAGPSRGGGGDDPWSRRGLGESQVRFVLKRSLDGVQISRDEGHLLKRRSLESGLEEASGFATLFARWMWWNPRGSGWALSKYHNSARPITQSIHNFSLLRKRSPVKTEALDKRVNI